MTKTMLVVFFCLILQGCVWNKIYVQNCGNVKIDMPASTTATVPVTSTANVPVSGGAAATGDTTTNATK